MGVGRIVAGTVVTQNREPVAVEVDRSVVMMSLAQGRYYGLEGPGGRIWKLIEQPRTVAEVVATLMQEFDVDAQACERDVIEFFEELAANDLIVIVDSPSDPVRPAARA